MKALIFSDIHFEFHKDRGHSFVKSQSSADHDVCLVAGDITDYHGLTPALELLANNFKEVVFVIGNHECYGRSIEAAKNKANEACDKYSNLHFLNNSSVEIAGQRFIGGTLWFPDQPDNLLHRHKLRDFLHINDFNNTVYVENEKSVKYLNKTMCSTDVVLTHHLPSEQCVTERFRGNSLNRFFVCDIEKLILERQPKLMVAGHSHDSCDFMIDNTRMLRNPFGYAKHEENKKFKDQFVIEL